MESFEKMLAVGGKSNSLGRATEVINLVLNDHSRLDELFTCISAEDPWVRMRTIDSFEKITRIHPEWIEPYLDTILHKFALSTQPSIQWHLAQIFAETNLSDEQRGRAISWLKEVIATPEVDWIVSTNVMKALLKFERERLVNTSELLPLFQIQEQHKSKSVRKKAAEFIKKIQTKQNGQ